MCAYSIGDICQLGHRIRPLDKLYDTIVLAVEKEDLYESADSYTVYNTLLITKKKDVKKAVSELVYYVPYRLLAYLWKDELKGLKDTQKNKLIETYSHEHGKNIYSIFTLK